MDKTVLLTGATGAIGKATAIELSRKNNRLILLGRDMQKLEALKTELISQTGNNEIESIQADLSEFASIRQAVVKIKSKYNSINVLLNVAAIFKSSRILNSSGLEYMFATNHLGPFLLTNELINLLKAGKPARIITVSAPSITKINFEDLNGEKKFSAGFTGAFGASKMMNLMFTYALARRIEGSGVNATVFHPGLVKSELTREMPAFLNFIFKNMSSHPSKAGKMLAALALDSKYDNSNGLFIKVDGKEITSNKYSYDKDLQEKLWNMSEKLTR